MSIPLFLLAAHFIGDFLLQSDWQATNKSKRWDALGIHVAFYMVPFIAVAPWLLGNTPAAVHFLVLTALFHFAQDAATSRVNAKLWFFQREVGIWEQAAYTLPKHGRTIVNPWTPLDGKRHWFFVAIGADQLLHFALLSWTYHFVTIGAR